jgi:hypothetical protein
VFVFMAAGCEGSSEDKPGDAPYFIAVSNDGSNKLVLTITGDSDAVWHGDSTNPGYFIGNFFVITNSSGTVSQASMTFSGSISTNKKVLPVTVTKKSSSLGAVIFTPRFIVNKANLGFITSSAGGKTLNVKVTESPVTLTIN